MRRIDLLEHWLGCLWVAGDPAAAAEFLEPGALARGLLPGAAVPAEDFAELVAALRQHLLHPQIALLRHLQCGDRLWALVEFNARSAHDLAPIRIDGQVMVRFAGPRIAEACPHFDLLPLFETLGFLPPDTLALCLAGERIG